MKNIKKLTIMLIGLGAIQTTSAQESNYLIHKADVTNIASNYTQVDHENMNDKVFLYPLMTHNFNPGGGSGVYHLHPVTVGRFDKVWRIMNDNEKPFTKNTYWNIFLPGPDFKSWPHVTTAENSYGNHTIIDHPDLNGNPNAKVFVSKLFSQDGGSGKLNDHTIGVFYSTLKKKWAIFNQDVQSMETGLTFVVSFNDNSPHSTFIHQSDEDNTSGHITTINHPDCNGNPNAKVIVTQNWRVGGSTGKYNNHEVGVYYNGAVWAIYNEDKTDLTVGASFNILVVNEETASTKNNDFMNIPSLRIAPNPAQVGDQIQIDLYNESSDPLQLEVMDMTGKIVIQEEIKDNNKVIIYHLSTAGIEPGMYMVRISNRRLAAVRRLVIN